MNQPNDFHLVVIDDSPGFLQSVDFSCKRYGWRLSTYTRAKAVEDLQTVGGTQEFILLDASLLNTLGDAQARDYLHALKSKFQDASTILLTARDKCWEESYSWFIYAKKNKLFDLAEYKPFPISTLGEFAEIAKPQPVAQEEGQLNDIFLQAAKNHPAALAIYRVPNTGCQSLQLAEPIWRNKLFKKDNHSKYEQRLFNVLMRRFDDGSSYEHCFAPMEKRNWHIRSWYLREEKLLWWVKDDHEQPDKGWLDSIGARLQVLNRLKEVSRMLARLYGISRLRLYEVEKLPDDFEYDKTDQALMVPRFATGGGLGRQNDDGSWHYDTSSWYERAFLYKGELSGRSPDIYNREDNIHYKLEEVSDSGNDPDQVNHGCTTISWGEAGTRAQLIYQGEQVWVHMAIDQRFGHIGDDKTLEGKPRAILQEVLDGAGGAQDREAGDYIGYPPLTHGEMENMQPTLKAMRVPMLRWFKRRRERSLRYWQLIVNRANEAILKKNDIKPDEVIPALLQSMQYTWPGTQGLLIPDEKQLGIIGDFNPYENKACWQTHMQEFQKKYFQYTKGVDHPPQMFDRFLTPHVQKGLSGLYLVRKSHDDLFICLGGVGTIADLRSKKDFWRLGDPHKTAFNRLKQGKSTCLQDYHKWAEHLRLDFSKKDDPKWQEALQALGSWCAVPLKSSQTRPTLLVASSGSSHYFTKSRVELLTKAAEHLQILVRWYDSCHETAEVTQNLTHFVHSQLSDLEDLIDQNGVEGARAMMPLFRGLAASLELDRNPAAMDAEQSYASLGEACAPLAPLAQHPSYRMILDDWNKLASITDFVPNIPTNLLTVLFYNLVINASKYAKEGERLYINVKLSADQVEIHLCNQSAVTVTQYDREYLHLRGYRPANSARGGSGTGLAIVATLCERFGLQWSLCPPGCCNCHEHYPKIADERLFGQSLLLPRHKRGNEDEYMVD